MSTRNAILAILLSIAFSISCGTEQNGPLAPGNQPVTPQPNPDGVLLTGNGTDTARQALVDLPPSAVEAAEIVDGLLTTRLVGSVASTATVAEVNAALEAQGARLVTMAKDNPFVTIKIPAVADAALARAVATALMQSAAFNYAAPAHVVAVEVPVLQPPTKASATALYPLPGTSAEAPDHLLRSRMLPAWNVSELALSNNDQINVLVPDEYASQAPHAEIDAQSFESFGAPILLPGPSIYPGNNGFVVSGVIGANVDETQSTGTSPYPAELLDIQSMPMGGLTWHDVFFNLAWDISSSGDRFVLNTGIGYNEPEYTTYSRLERAMDVISWRFAAALHYDKFIHVTSAGNNEGDADYNSPFIAAARFTDVREMVDLDTLSPEDSMAIETAWEDLNNALPAAALAAPNVVVVGSSGPTGAVSSFSAVGDVQAIGESVVGPCVSQDPEYTPGYLCDGEVAYYSGTGVAAAQVSGLAAYMMNLRDVTPARVRQIILERFQSSTNGLVDAYDTVLALDDVQDQPVREALLDVAGFESSESDGSFTQYDLAALTDLTSGGVVVASEPTDIYPASFRRDFNGDGIVGGIATHRFDLDNNGTYSAVTQTIEGNPMQFDENAVTDFQIVCYYAYSDVYSGDLTERAQYVVPGHSGLFVQIAGLPERASPGETAEVTVTAGYNVPGGGVTLTEGIQISLELDGMETPTSGGQTGAGGIFQTTVTFGNDDNDMVFGAWAETPDEEVYAEKTTRRNNQVELVERQVYAHAQVFAAYTEDVGVPSERFIQQYLFMQTTHFAAVDTMLAQSDNRSAAGMNVSGTANNELTTRVDLGSGTDLYGIYFSSESSASITLTNPNFNISRYQAQSDAEVDVSVEFIVWGDPAAFNMHGDVSSREYDIELSGPNGDLFVCDSNDDPCFTISTGGMLPPGRYRLSAYHVNGGYIRWFEGCTGCTTSGTQSSNGSLNLNFEVNHNG